jgi:transposase-like protein
MNIPKELLSKEFLVQFKSQEDVSQFMKDLHAKVYEQLLESELDAHLGYDKHSKLGNNTGNSRNGEYGKQLQTEHGEQEISVPRDRNGEFEPITVPKHQNRGLSIEKLVISLYAKGMSVSDIEEEMTEIYHLIFTVVASGGEAVKFRILQKNEFFKIKLYQKYDLFSIFV